MHMETRGQAHPFLFNGALSFTRRPKIDRLLEVMLEKTFALSRLDQMYQALPVISDLDTFLQRVLTTFNVTAQCSDAELNNTPRSGAAVVVANHPFGALEGVMLALLLRRIRPDVKIMANYFLQRVPEIKDLFIGVDPFGGSNAARHNMRPLRDAMAWLDQGGLLVVFPAGEVSHLHFTSGRTVDPRWHNTVARLVRRAEAPVVPVYFHGSNSLWFHLAGLLHPRLRTALLPRELINKRNRVVPVNVGGLIPYAKLKDFSNDDDMTSFLRLRCYALAERSTTTLVTQQSCAHCEEIAAAVPPALLQAEVAVLPQEQMLDKNGNLQVFFARAGQIPWLLQEIGRLREITFRAAGEGTGRSRDIDLYDAYYLHLFIWDSASSQIVGAYRLGLADEIVRNFGKQGLYTHSLFKYSNSLLNELNPAIELGRSFIRPEYQRSYSPLLLLWKGIGQFVARHPQYRMLFGPVSISSDYQTGSQQLLVDFLRANNFEPGLARYVRPRRPFRRVARGAVLSSSANLRDLDSLSELVSAIEQDQKGVPVLLRQYLKLGGRILGFNVDEQFNHALDGLIMVDLRQTDSRVLTKYMGREQAEGFLAMHGAGERLAS